MSKLAKLFVCLLFLLPGGVRDAICATVDWYYEDDFNTIKAKTDSYDHSIFWPERAVPPPEPYLYYTGHPQGMLAFGDFYGQPAYLAYAFPLATFPPPPPVQVDSGTFEIDVSFEEGIPEPNIHVYQLSQDGNNWTPSYPLHEGHNRIALLPSDNAHTYIRLSAIWGTLIDNLSVTIPAQEIVAGDMNLDGEIDADDINPFVLAIVEPNAYYYQYGIDPNIIGDCDASGKLDAYDIKPFTALLTGGSQAIPEPATLGLLAAVAPLLLKRRRR